MGNRTSIDENGTVTSYTANALNQYTAITGLAVTHTDGRGNLTQLGGWTYTYDADNRLTQASGGGYSVQFYYDPEGRLTRVNRNGTSEYRHYDGGQCFLRTQADGTWIDFMILGPTPDELTSRWDAAHGGSMFFHHTPVNSPDLATDIGCNVVERYLYDPFGAPDIRDPSWGGRSSSVIANPWLFTGQEWMSDTGLSNYKARFYSPKLGRFLQNDPVRFEAGDVNLYRYCSNNTINFRDPSGLAYIGDRPVDGTAAIAAKVVKRTPIHREMFFEDGEEPEHIGFFYKKGVTYDEATNLPRYNNRFPATGKSLDDQTAREAVANVIGTGNWTPDQYSEDITCQEFIQAILREMKRLEDLKKQREKPKPKPPGTPPPPPPKRD